MLAVIDDAGSRIGYAIYGSRRACHRCVRTDQSESTVDIREKVGKFKMFLNTRWQKNNGLLHLEILVEVMGSRYTPSRNPCT